MTQRTTAFVSDMNPPWASAARVEDEPPAFSPPVSSGVRAVSVPDARVVKAPRLVGVSSSVRGRAHLGRSLRGQGVHQLLSLALGGLELLRGLAGPLEQLGGGGDFLLPRGALGRRVLPSTGRPLSRLGGVVP